MKDDSGKPARERPYWGYDKQYVEKWYKDIEASGLKTKAEQYWKAREEMIKNLYKRKEK